MLKSDRPQLLCSHYVKKQKAESWLSLSLFLSDGETGIRAAPNPHGKWKVAGLMAYWQAAWQECVYDQEAPTCSNRRCGEGDRRETKGTHNTWNKAKTERALWQRSKLKTYNGQRAVSHLFWSYMTINGTCNKIHFLKCYQQIKCHLRSQIKQQQDIKLFKWTRSRLRTAPPNWEHTDR